MGVNNLKDIFFTIGVFTTTVFILGFIVLSVVKLKDSIVEYRDSKRYEYEMAHRFDNPPLAKCHCIDCKYCYGEPTKTGGYVYCSLWNGSVIIRDNSFCYRAEPKPKEREKKK